MKTPFQIEESALLTFLNKQYGIGLESIEFIPIGDSAYSYKLNGDNGQRFHMKLFDHSNGRQRNGVMRLPSYLPLTWHLFHQGLFPHISYPIETLAGELQASLPHCTLVLFNFIEGDTLAEGYPFSKEVVERLAKSEALLHQATPYIDQSMLQMEDYNLDFLPDLRQCMSVLESSEPLQGSIQTSLRQHVLAKKELIAALIRLTEELRGLVVADPKPVVICHGDLWGGNLILHQEHLYFIDWESALLAPPEMDWVKYMGEEFEVFFDAYTAQWGQAVTVNPDLLRFYAYRQHLRNLSNWLLNILYRNSDEAQNKNDLDMILHHCMNRWDRIEPDIQGVEAVLRKNKQ